MAEKVASNIAAFRQLAAIATGVKRTIAEIWAALMSPAASGSAGSTSSPIESVREIQFTKDGARLRISLGQELLIERIVREAWPSWAGRH